MMSLLPVSLLPAAINHLLAAEPWAQQRLAAHAGRVAAIDAGVAAFRWRVLPDGSVAAADNDATADVTIRIAAADLPRIAQRPEHAFSYVKIEGDAGFAATISQIGQTVRWDAEGDLSRLVGDIAAVRIVGGVKAAFRTAASTGRALAENLAEYLTEEQPVLAQPVAVNELAQDVVRLRDDVERLAKRIERLERGAAA